MFSFSKQKRSAPATELRLFKREQTPSPPSRSFSQKTSKSMNVLPTPIDQEQFSVLDTPTPRDLSLGEKKRKFDEVKIEGQDRAMKSKRNKKKRNEVFDKGSTENFSPADNSTTAVIIPDLVKGLGAVHESIKCEVKNENKKRTSGDSVDYSEWLNFLTTGTVQETDNKDQKPMYKVVIPSREDREKEKAALQALAKASQADLNKNTPISVPGLSEVKKCTPIPVPYVLGMDVNRDHVVQAGRSARPLPPNLSPTPVTEAHENAEFDETSGPNDSATGELNQSNQTSSLSLPMKSKCQSCQNPAGDNWESNPGIIRGHSGNDDTDTIENIAFAAQYITSRPGGIIIIGNNRFQVVSLAPGKKYIMSAASASICSVAKGTVTVKVGKNKRFPIGENGMWKYKDNEKCKIQNHGEEDAVVHVTARVV